MAFVHGRNSVVLVNKFDLSQYFNEASISNSVETAETTAFGNAAKTYISGLKDGTISLSGMFEAANGASSIDKVISDALQVDDAVFTFAPERKTGGVAYSCIADPTSYEVSSSVSDLVSMSAELQSDKGIDRAIVLSGTSSSFATTLTTATTFDDPSYDYAISNKSGLVATLVAGSNTVTLTTGNTTNLAIGAILTVTSGAGAFGVGAVVQSIIDSTNFTTSVPHATAGSTTFSANTPSSGVNAVAYLHVTANANVGTATFTVWDSADNVSFTQIPNAGFTVVPASTTAVQRLEISAGQSIRRYVRARCVTSGAGSITYTITFARR